MTPRHRIQEDAIGHHQVQLVLLMYVNERKLLPTVYTVHKTRILK